MNAQTPAQQHPAPLDALAAWLKALENNKPEMFYGSPPCAHFAKPEK